MFARLYAKYRVEVWLVLGGIGVCAIYAAVQLIVMSDPGRTNYVQVLGVPLDDVYIHLRYAQNLQHGFGYSFNPREILTADTSPLWVVLIALFGWTSHLELVAIVLSVLSYLIIAPGIYRTSRDLLHVSESNARLAGWIAVLTSRLAWSAMSGMETALAVLLMLLAVESHIRACQRRCISAKEALWLGLGMLVRPEFALVTMILVAHWVYVLFQERIDRERVPLAVLLIAVLGAPAVLLPLATTGSVFAHSSLVQAGTASASLWQYTFFTIKTLAEPNILIALLALVAMIMRRQLRAVGIMSAILIVLVASQALFAPQTRHHGRYLFPQLPLVILMAIVAWQQFSSSVSPKLRSLTPILIITFGVISTARWAYLAASDVRNINDQHLAAAHWLVQNHRANDVIAAGDVGAIGYFTGERILDPNGLVTPAAWDARSNPDSLWHVLRAQGANVFAIYPHWNREFFTRYQDSLVLRGSFTVRLPLTSAADTTLNIYRLRSGS